MQDTLPEKPTAEVIIPEQDKPAFELAGNVQLGLLGLVKAGAEDINVDFDSGTCPIAAPSAEIHNSKLPFQFEDKTVTLSAELATDDKHETYDPRLSTDGVLKISSRTSVSFEDARGKRSFGIAAYSDGSAQCFEWLPMEEDGFRQGPNLAPDTEEFGQLTHFSDALVTAAEQVSQPETTAIAAVGQVAIGGGAPKTEA